MSRILGQDRALTTLRDNPAIDESVLFSTCNRIELLMAAKESQSAIAAAKRFLSEFKGVPLTQFEKALYQYTGDEAVRHTFQVASVTPAVRGCKKAWTRSSIVLPMGRGRGTSPQDCSPWE